MAVGMSRQRCDDEVVLRAECLFHNGGDYAEVIRTYALHHGCQLRGIPPRFTLMEKNVFSAHYKTNQLVSQLINQSVNPSVGVVGK